MTVILTGGEPSLWIDREFVGLPAPDGEVCLYRNERYAFLAG